MNVKTDNTVELWFMHPFELEQSDIERLVCTNKHYKVIVYTDSDKISDTIKSLDIEVKEV